MTILKPKLGWDFFFFQCGTTAGLLTGHVMRIAVAWWCLEETKSAVFFAMVISFSVGFEIYLSPLLSSFGDHYPRMKLICASQWSISLLCLVIFIINMLWHFNIYVLTSLLMLISVLVCFRDPVIAGTIPDLVKKEDISCAISRRSQINSIYIFLGPLIAAFMTSYFGVTTTLLSALIFSVLSSAFYQGLIVIKHENHPPSPHSGREKIEWLKKTKGGFTAIINVKSELYIAAFAAIINFNMYPFFSVTVPYWINQDLRLPASYLGLFEGAFGLGLIAGSAFFVKMLNEYLGRFYTILSGFLLLGLSVICIVSTAHHYIILFFAFVCGVSFMLININLNTLRVSATPPSYRVRMSAVASFLSRFFNPAGVFISGLAIAHFGVQNVVITSGVLIVLIVPFLVTSRNVRNALSLSTQDMDGYYEKTYPSAFK